MASLASLNSNKKDWKGAFRATRALLNDPNDTAQAFRIMAALNAGTSARNYQRLLKTPEGGRIAFKHVELVEKLTDQTFLAQFAPTGFSADGLAAVSREVEREGDSEHPYIWFGRRERDLHDIWHVLSGYKADDPLGELCLVAFTFPQSKGLGWGFLAVSGALKSLTEPHSRSVIRAIWEGYRHGRKASWLHKEDIEVLFAEPLDAARARLNIERPVAYEQAQQKIGAAVSGTWVAQQV
jgi:ubiquinone biosynthesis protein COQ4